MGEKNLYQTNERILLASAYVVYQNSDFENIFEPADALTKGTLFPELYLPKLGMEEFYEK